MKKVAHSGKKSGGENTGLPRLGNKVKGLLVLTVIRVGGEKGGKRRKITSQPKLLL